MLFPEFISKLFFCSYDFDRRLKSVALIFHGQILCDETKLFRILCLWVITIGIVVGAHMDRGYGKLQRGAYYVIISYVLAVQ